MTDFPGRHSARITGGIAAYKAAELTRLFVQGGRRVRVVMTEVCLPLHHTGDAAGAGPASPFSPTCGTRASSSMANIELSRDRDIIASRCYDRFSRSSRTAWVTTCSRRCASRAAARSWSRPR